MTINQMDILSSKDGAAAFRAGASRSANPYIGRNPSISGQMWDSGYCHAAGISPLSADPASEAKRRGIIAEWDTHNAAVAAQFPEAWQRAQAKRPATRREAQRKLRRAFDQLTIN